MGAAGFAAEHAKELLPGYVGHRCVGGKPAWCRSYIIA
jgi:hypothetical protein